MALIRVFNKKSADFARLAPTAITNKSGGNEKTMKSKLLAVLFGILMSFSFTACSKNEGQAVPDADSSPSEELPVLPEEPDEPDLPSEEQPDEPNEPETPDEPNEPEIPDEPNVPNNPDTPSEPNKPAVPEEPPAPPKPQTDDLVSSTVNGLNIRSGAGTGYSAFGTLDKSDMAMPVRKVGSWYEIQYKNKLGYVSSAYVTSVSFEKGSNAIERVVDAGKKLLGLPYVFGAQRYHWGNGVLNTNYDGKSYDCSSLMQYIFKKGANVNLAMTSREQSLQGNYVAKKDIRRGDLLFFTNASRYNKTGIERIGHVALYLGDNIILHTASDHAVIEPMSAQRHEYYITARRIV